MAVRKSSRVKKKVRSRAARMSPGPAPRGRRLTAAGELGERGYVAGGRPPAADLGGAAPVRVTAYLRPDQVIALRRRVAELQARGERADMSALLREAADLLLKMPKKRRRS